jgi:hypothetical protein
MTDIIAHAPLGTVNNPTWRPFADASNFPIDQLNAEGKALHSAWQDRLQSVTDLQQAAVDAQKAVHLAETALTAELEREAETGKVGAGPDLKVKFDRRVAEADPELHRNRIDQAEGLAYRAGVEYENHLNQQHEQYLAKLKPDCERVAAEIRRVNAEHAERLGPLVLKREVLRHTVLAAIGRTPPFVSEDVPSDLETAPFPTEDALARRQLVLNPPPEPEPQRFPQGWIEKPERTEGEVYQPEPAGEIAPVVIP